MWSSPQIDTSKFSRFACLTLLARSAITAADLPSLQRLARPAAPRSSDFSYSPPRKEQSSPSLTGDWRRNCSLATQLKEPRLC